MRLVGALPVPISVFVSVSALVSVSAFISVPVPVSVSSPPESAGHAARNAVRVFLGCYW